MQNLVKISKIEFLVLLDASYQAPSQFDDFRKPEI